MSNEAEKYDVILSPVVSEKSTLLSEYNQVMFKVAGWSTKPQIKEAVEKLFEVKVEAVNTRNRKSKAKVFKGRKGRKSDTKFAIVTLKDGERIDITSGI